MKPFFFNSDGRRLYGVFHNAFDGVRGKFPVLLCSPVGQEAIRTYRAQTLLANMLAKGGIPSLRFDYFATGDSEGDTLEGCVEQWRDDIRAAARELRELSGGKKISIVGLRLGATLAAQSIANTIDVDTLIIWEPVDCGSSWLNMLAKMTESANSEVHRATDEKHELVGFEYGTNLYQQISELDLASVNDLSLEHAAFVGMSQPSAAVRNLIGSAVTQAEAVTTGTPGWESYSEHDAPYLPTNALQFIVKELGRRFPL